MSSGDFEKQRAAGGKSDRYDGSRRSAVTNIKKVKGKGSLEKESQRASSAQLFGTATKKTQACLRKGGDPILFRVEYPVCSGYDG